MKVHVELQPGKAMADREMEIVERKGRGHPDSMCDAMLEEVSRDLSRYYLERFGAVLHHNIDKGLLAAGAVKKWFGGGEIVRPMELTIGDRATGLFREAEIPVADIARGAVERWLRENLRFAAPQTSLSTRIVLAEGSAELTGIFSRPGILLGANDTSAAVGFYPLSPTERLVLDLESHLNGESFKQKFPETGEDVKVMAVRRGRILDLTVAMPLLVRFVTSEQDYFERREAIRKAIRRFAEGQGSFERIAVRYNALDRLGNGLEGIYLSLIGTSAEDADSGQVGRGNRVNGLISVTRPLGTEAVAGKNPVSHVGKIYNVLAHRTARQIYEKVVGAREVTVFLVSRIGQPIDRPQLAAVHLLPERGVRVSQLRRAAVEIVEANLSGIDSLCKELIAGKHRVC